MDDSRAKMMRTKKFNKLRLLSSNINKYCFEAAGLEYKFGELYQNGSIWVADLKINEHFSVIGVPIEGIFGTTAMFLANACNEAWKRGRSSNGD